MNEVAVVKKLDKRSIRASLHDMVLLQHLRPLMKSADSKQLQK